MENNALPQAVSLGISNAPAAVNPFEQAALALLSEAIVVFSQVGMTALMQLITKAIQSQK